MSVEVQIHVELVTGFPQSPPRHFRLDNVSSRDMASSAAIDALAGALVARFLRTNNFTDTLQAFLREAGLPSDVGQTFGDDTNNWTIQSLLEEKKAFDHSVDFERYGQESKENVLWSTPGEYWPQVAEPSIQLFSSWNISRMPMYVPRLTAV